MSCLNRGSIIVHRMYNYDFHKSIEHEELPQAQRLANYIHRHVKPSVFLDFGCSSGLYLREIKRVMPTIEAKGFEFSEDAVRHALCSDVNQCDLDPRAFETGTKCRFRNASHGLNARRSNFENSLY